MSLSSDVLVIAEMCLQKIFSISPTTLLASRLVVSENFGDDTAMTDDPS